VTRDKTTKQSSELARTTQGLRPSARFRSALLRNFIETLPTLIEYTDSTPARTLWQFQIDRNRPKMTMQ
jgi:hypothetical protein